MKTEFHPEAYEEMRESARYYEETSSGRRHARPRGHASADFKRPRLRALSRYHGCASADSFVAAVDRALARFAQDKTIRRLAQGLYDYPRVHKKLGILAEDIDLVRALGA